MLIEQIVDFELRRPAPYSRICTPTSTTGYFYDKTKISKANLRVDYYLLLKYWWRQYTVLSPTWAKPLTNLTPKWKILNMFWI